MAAPKSNQKAKTLREAMAVVAMVECKQCGKMHRADSKDYYVIWGNISVGADDLVVTKNIDERGRVVGSIVLCCEGDCLAEFSKVLKGIVDRNDDARRAKAGDTEQPKGKRK